MNKFMMLIVVFFTFSLSTKSAEKTEMLRFPDADFRSSSGPGMENQMIFNGVQVMDNMKQTFIINTCTTDLNEFRKLAQSVSRLKKYGDVQINVGTVADKAFINSLKRIDKNKPQYIFIYLNAWCNRDDESLQVADLMFELIDDYLGGRLNSEETSQKLQEYCKTWGGEKYATILNNALNDLNKTFRFRRPNLNNLYGVYWGVSSRMLTRPLVAAPQRLTPEEESYFLPYIFNVSEEEARMDYIDIHGGLEMVCHANDRKHEDCFLLGPDLISQLKKKSNIMLDHWRDIEDYMTTPYK